MIVSEIKLYELLKAKLGEQEAEAFVSILETKVDKKFDEAKQYLATKADIAETRSEIVASKAEILRWTFAFVFGASIINIVSIIAAVIAVANIIKH